MSNKSKSKKNVKTLSWKMARYLIMRSIENIVKEGYYVQMENLIKVLLGKDFVYNLETNEFEEEEKVPSPRAWKRANKLINAYEKIKHLDK
ncbi:MAG TPA: hypothetical protein P5136_01585 [Methanofastidiosum sp.]|nr:hypothetical protein [Methanofastidiosum sp.]